MPKKEDYVDEVDNEQEDDTSTSNSNNESIVDEIIDEATNDDEGEVNMEVNMNEGVSKKDKPKSTASSSALTDAKKYKCPYCATSFTNFGVYANHVRNSHPEEVAKNRAKKQEGSKIRGKNLVDEDEREIERDREREREEYEPEEREEAASEGSEEDYINEQIEQEIVLREGEEGISRLRYAKLVRLLNIDPSISDKVKRSVIGYYKFAPNIYRDNNNLLNLLKSSGVAPIKAEQIVRLIAQWEDELLRRLYYQQSPHPFFPSFPQSLSQQQQQPYPYHHYYYHQHQQQPYPAAQPPYQYPYRPFPRPGMYPEGYGWYPPPPPPPSQYPAPSEGKGITAEDVRKIIKEVITEKEKKTEIDRLKEEVKGELESMKRTFAETLEALKQRSVVEYVEYEEVARDSLGNILFDEEGKPIKVVRKMPLHEVKTHGQLNDFQTVLELVKQLTKGSNEGQQAFYNELKSELKRIQEQYEKVKEELTNQQIQALQSELQNLRASLASVSNSTGWNTDAARLIATSMNNLASIIEKKSPVRDLATIITGVPSSSQPPPTGDVGAMESYAAEAGILDERS